MTFRVMKDGVFGAAGDLDTACENCHQTFWYPEPKSIERARLEGTSITGRGGSE